MQVKTLKSEKYEKIAFSALLLFIFLLPVQTRWIIRGGDINGVFNEFLTISVYAVDLILVFALATAFSIKIASFRKDSRQTGIWWLLAGFDLAVFISVLFAGDKLLALFRYVQLLAGIGLFWLVLHYSKHLFTLISAFVAGALLQSMLGIWQFLNQRSFSSKWLGISSHDAAESGTSVVSAIGNLGLWERWLRAYGGLDHPNVLGGLSAAGIILCLVLAVKINLGTLKGKVSLLAIYASVSILSMGLFFTFSRSAWLGTFFALAVVLTLSVSLKIKKNLLVVAKIFLIVLSIFIAMFLTYKNLVLVRFEADTRLEKYSISERVESSLQARKMIIENLKGVGIGNYVNEIYEKKSGEKSSDLMPVHNVFLLAIAETGLIGGIFLVLFLLYLLKNIFNNYHNQYGILCFAIFAMFFVLLSFDHWIWSLHFGVFFFWFISGLIAALCGKNFKKMS